MKKFILKLSLFLGGFLSCYQVLGVVEQDSLALVALYNSTNGPNWINTWDLNTPVDTWYGVTAEFTEEYGVVELDLTNNGLVGTFPALEMNQLLYLTTLRLGGNELTDPIPNTIVELTSLTELDISNNNFTNIDILSFLPFLEELYVAGNQLSAIPVQLVSMQDTEVLDFSGNQLTSLPTFGFMPELEELYLSNNQLKSLPATDFTFENLKELDLSFNKFDSIEAGISGFIQLEILDMSNNQITKINKEVEQLQDLERLDLSNNLLDSIPHVNRLGGLYMLDLSHNKIKVMPRVSDDFFDLYELGELNLSNNKLKTLPGNLNQMVNLEILLLHNNQLEDTVSYEMLEGLVGLKRLFLFGNNLTELGDLSLMGNLEVLQVMNNFLTFEDLETNVGQSFDFFYAPQKDQTGSDTFELFPGDTVTIGRYIGGDNNINTWFKDGQAEQTETSFLEIQNLSFKDAGVYTLIVSHPEVDLEYRYTYTIQIEPNAPKVKAPFPYCIADDKVVLTVTEQGGANTYWFYDAEMTDTIGEGESVIVNFGVINEQGQRIELDRRTIYVVNQAGLLEQEASLELIRRPAIDTIGSSQLFVEDPQAVSYQWYYQGNPIEGATEQTYTMQAGEEEGPYTVTVVTEQGCAATSRVYPEGDKILGISPGLFTEASVAIYPNPSRESLHLSVRNDYIGKMYLAIYNMMGKLCWEKAFYKANQHFLEGLALPALPQGIYTLRISGGEEIFVGKVIKR